jgi:ABC-type glycerol-3-phosphate transport system substrate-binding protein
MKRARIGAVLVPAAMICVLLAGCGLGLEPTVQLMTNRPEMAAYVDRFNAMQSDVRVEIAYQETPSQAVLDGAQADLVIGEWLASPGVMDHLDGLGDLVKPGKIDPGWFYSRLLAMGSRDNRPVLVPLSFSLPAIVYVRQPTEMPTMFMPIDTLRTMGKAFNKANKAGMLLNVGFSPAWNHDFLTSVALLYGTRFRPGRGGLPAWDENGVKKTVDLTRTWLTDVNGGVAADESFRNRALMQPWYRLLSSGKTLFAMASFTDYFALPEEERRDLDFRWLSQDGMIPVLDNVLFAGVIRSGRNKAGARSFLQWFCSPAVQQSLLTFKQSRRIGVFGVTDGFSSLKTINEKDLPQKYPLLLGHIPLENLLTFPDPLPDNWVKVRDAAITPWILQTAAGTETETLEKTIADWVDAQKKG